MSLPDIHTIAKGGPSTASPLAIALSTLFEPSPILLETLEPQLAALLQTVDGNLSSYEQLVDIAISVISSWSPEMRAQFIEGHPRIGESKNLSNLSAQEQGVGSSATATAPEVLARLVHLNACYEQKYPGLRYITFVNGRSRPAIAEEMESAVGIEHSMSPQEPAVASFQPVTVGGKEWKDELDRAIIDIENIAKSRLRALRV